MLALLDDPVTVREGGEVKQIQPAEVTALRMIAKALNGDRKALLYILAEFETQGLISACPEPVCLPESGLAGR